MRNNVQAKSKRRGLNYSKLIQNKQKPRQQLKLHNEQMTRYDLDNLANLVRTLNPNQLIMSKHVINKNDSRFTLALFRWVLNRNLDTMEKKIVEYNEIPISTILGTQTDKRVLIRDDSEIYGLNLCIVLSLTQNKIVTAYWNEIEDAHEDLNWDRYNKKFAMSI
jgi:hypothetical protein